MMKQISASFFERNPVVCARELIGAHFLWNACVGRIVETEAYLSVDDPACHTWSRPSARAFVQNHRAGDAYVYLNYGAHWLFNVLVKGGDESGFVLFRALEPVSGIERMRGRREGVADRLLGAGAIDARLRDRRLGPRFEVPGTPGMRDHLGRTGRSLRGRTGWNFPGYRFTMAFR